MVYHKLTKSCIFTKVAQITVIHCQFTEKNFKNRLIDYLVEIFCNVVIINVYEHDIEYKMSFCY